LKLTTNVVVANPADLGLAALGGPEAVEYLADGLGPGYVNPATYGSAGTIPGGAAAAALAKDVTASSAPMLDGQAESRAVAEIVSAMSDQGPGSAAASTLLLAPLLTSMVSGR
jgi:hypothetical protein